MTEFIKIAKWSIDLTSVQVGRLMVIGPVARCPAGQVKWLCQCLCGKQTIVRAGELNGRKTASCGCLASERMARISRKHGMSSSSEFKIWSGIFARCDNPRCKEYPRYGGRGITVCDRWRRGEGGKEAFTCFLEDMGPRPSLRHSVDRRDNDGNYDPGNCRWATNLEQQNNRSITKYLEFGDQRKPLTQWAREVGLPSDVVRDRLRKGYTVQRAITQPFGRKKILTHQGQSLTTEEWSARTGIKPDTIRKRLRIGWSVERALTDATLAKNAETA